MGISAPLVKADPYEALPKCNAWRRNRGQAEIAIAGAAEIMKLNRDVEPGGAHTYLTNSQRVRRSFRGRGTSQLTSLPCAL
jgi:hypothetical protein